MKKQIIIFLNLLLLIILCGCSSSVYTVEMNGKDYEVNYNTNTIYDGTYTYEFDYTGNAKSYVIDITYPNGAVYSESYDDEDEAALVSSTREYGEGIDSSDKSYKGYEYGGTLCYLITYKDAKTPPGVKILIFIFGVALGIFFIIAPDKVWMICEGWKYNNVEPSNMRLAMVVLTGVFLIIVGFISIFF